MRASLITSFFLHIKLGIRKATGSVVGMKALAKSTKRLNAEAFMRYLKVLYFGDDFVTKEGVGKVNNIQ
jgi:hypothetical protein